MNAWLAEKIDTDVPVGESLIRRYKALYETEVIGLGLKTEFLERASDYEGVQVHLLENMAGVRVLVIDESTHMTTGTYKALDACLICADAQQKGINRVVLSSGGNLGRAVSHYCSRAGMHVFLFHPKSTLHKLERDSFPTESTTVISVDLHERKVKELSRQFAETFGLAHVPEMRLRIAASAARALHLIETISSHGPVDTVAQAVCAAYGPVGIYDFFDKLLELGCIVRHQIPRFLGIQQTANAPICLAWQQGGSELLQLEIASAVEKYIEPGLYNTHPVDSYPQFYALMRRFGCEMLGIRESEFSERSKQMVEALESTGFCFARNPVTGEIIEKAGLLAAVGVSIAIERGIIAQGETVALLLTGGSRSDGSHVGIDPDLVVDDSKPIDQWVSVIGKLFVLDFEGAR